MRSTSQIRRIAADDGVACGEIGRVCVVVWRREVTPARFAKQRAALAEVAALHPEGIGFVCVIEPTAPPPSEELRRASAAMIRENEAALRGIACAVEGTGFVAALARSALSTMALFVGPRRAPLTIAPSVTTAADWLAPRVGVDDPRTLARAAEQLRALLPLDAD